MSPLIFGYLRVEIRSQLPHASRFLERVTPLLKPNGWLLIEDTSVIEFPTAMGPAQKQRNEVMFAYMKSKGLDPHVGGHLEEQLRASGAFSEVNVREQVLPFQPFPDGTSPFAHARTECAVHTSSCR